MKSDKPPSSSPPARSSRGAGNDFAFDPLPIPEAVESDSETAWSLWEMTLKQQETAEIPTQPADFDRATEPQDLDELPTAHGDLLDYEDSEPQDFDELPTQHGDLLDDDELQPDFQATAPASLEDLEKLLKP